MLIVTSSCATQEPLVTVQRNVADDPVKVTVVVSLDVDVIVAVPDTTVQIPVPLVAVAAILKIGLLHLV